MEKGEIILYHPDNSIELEVRIDEETVWLTQAQMALLFETTRNNVTSHINNIFKEGELEESSVCKDSLLPASDGKKYHTKTYNLDVIISVGYRVKSKRGTQFRIWANKVLKEYLLHGHAINQRIERLEQRVSKAEENINFFVRTSLPPVEGVFFNGQIFDAYVFVTDLIRSAKKNIMLIDNYVDESVLLMLAKREPTVTAKLITHYISNQLHLDIERHNSQYPNIEIEEKTGIHDRFLIVDDTLYHLGASLKDLGKKLFAFSKMGIPPETILNAI